MMRRELLLSILSLLTTPLFAQEPTPAAPEPAPEPAPPPPPDVALLIGNVKAAYTPPLEKKAIQVLFRGMNVTTPGGARLMVYLPPAHDPALVATLDLLGWSETTFERLRLQVDSQVGRPYFKQLSSNQEVVSAVGADPGGLGVVQGSALLDERVVVLWRSGGGAP